MTLREEKVLHPLPVSDAAGRPDAVDRAMEDWLLNEVAPAALALQSDDAILLSEEEVRATLSDERALWMKAR